MELLKARGASRMHPGSLLCGPPHKSGFPTRASMAQLNTDFQPLMEVVSFANGYLPRAPCPIFHPAAITTRLTTSASGENSRTFSSRSPRCTSSSFLSMPGGT